jgi:hypothetical protein
MAGRRPTRPEAGSPPPAQALPTAPRTLFVIVGPDQTVLYHQGAVMAAEHAKLPWCEASFRDGAWVPAGTAKSQED